MKEELKSKKAKIYTKRTIEETTMVSRIQNCKNKKKIVLIQKKTVKFDTIVPNAHMFYINVVQTFYKPARRTWKMEAAQPDSAKVDGKYIRNLIGCPFYSPTKLDQISNGSQIFLSSFLIESTFEPFKNGKRVLRYVLHNKTLYHVPIYQQQHSVFLF